MANLSNQVRRYGDETVRAGRKTARAQKGGGLGGGGFKEFALARSAGLGAGAAAGLAAGPAAVGIGAIAGSVRAFAQAELAQVNLSRLLGKGTDETKKFIGELGEFAATTPFAIGQMEDLASRVLASNFAMEEVIPTLRQLGDVTGGNTDKMNRLLINFVEIRDNNRAFAKDLRQFTSAGVPIFDALVKTTGKTRAEIGEMTRRGEIDFKKIQKALDFLTKNGGKFENAMDDASKTTIGAFNELRERIVLLGRAFGSEIGGEDGFWQRSFKSMALSVKFLTENIDELIPALKILGAIAGILFIKFFPLTSLFLIMFIMIEDMVAFLDGRDSLIGRVFGQGGKIKPETIKDLPKETKKGMETFVGTAEFVKPIADALEKGFVFGKEGFKVFSTGLFGGNIPQAVEDAKQNIMEYQKNKQLINNHFSGNQTVDDAARLNERQTDGFNKAVDRMMKPRSTN